MARKVFKSQGILKAWWVLQTSDQEVKGMVEFLLPTASIVDVRVREICLLESE